MSKPKVVFIDIERAPSLGWVWGKWEQNVIDMEQDWYMLSFAWRWAGDKTVHVLSLADYTQTYKANPQDDCELARALWSVLDTADVVVAHNGDRFDVPAANTRFLAHGLKPPSPYRTVDTLKVARRMFKFDSNKLDDLGRALKIGRKMHHEGFPLWQACMKGDMKAWAKMKAYNQKDVILLEKVYKRMQAWVPSHPAVIPGATDGCPRCGSDHVQKRGFHYTPAGRAKQQYQCQKCGGWFMGRAA